MLHLVATLKLNAIIAVFFMVIFWSQQKVGHKFPWQQMLVSTVAAWQGSTGRAFLSRHLGKSNISSGHPKSDQSSIFLCPVSKSKYIKRSIKTGLACNISCLQSPMLKQPAVFLKQEVLPLYLHVHSSMECNFCSFFGACFKIHSIFHQGGQ